MPLNSCSINAHTLNSLACRRRGFVPPIPQPIAVKSHPQQVGYGARWPFSSHEEDDEQTFDNIESSHINVTISLGGKEYSQTELNSKMTDIIPLMSVGNLSVEVVEEPIDIQITGIKFSKERNR
jgi:hypothetical protein